jgi:regulator of protease activity HflC (stomatin/prohibitin superfamily)
VLATLIWMAALGALGYVVFSAARGRRFGGGAANKVRRVVLAHVVSNAPARQVLVDPEESAEVVTSLQQGGLRPEALSPGLHWMIPFAESIRRYDISRQTYTMSSSAGEGAVQGDDSVRARTKDGQEVFIDASVIFSVDPAKVIPLHVSWQSRYEQGVVRPLTRGIMRDTASQYGVEEIVSSKRDEMEATITQQLEAKLADNDLLLVDFILRDIHFSPEYAAAVEQKQIAEQQAQQAAFVVEQRRQEAEQARVTAQGSADAAIIAAEGRAQATVLQARAESESLQVIGETLKQNPEVLSFRYIDKLSPNVQVIYLPSDSQQFILPLPTPNATVVTSTTPTVLPTPTEPTTTTVTPP